MQGKVIKRTVYMVQTIKYCLSKDLYGKPLCTKSKKKEKNIDSKGAPTVVKISNAMLVKITKYS